MRDRARIFDDISGLAGGAFSALTGVKEELLALINNRVAELLDALELVRREEFDAMVEMVQKARDQSEQLRQQLERLEARLATLEGRPSEASGKKPD